MIYEQKTNMKVSFWVIYILHNIIMLVLLKPAHVMMRVTSCRVVLIDVSGACFVSSRPYI